MEQYNAANPELYLSLSIGSAVSSKEDFDLGETFKLADEAMFEDKLRRRRDVRNLILQVLKGFLVRKDVSSKEHSDRVKEIMRNFGNALGLAEGNVYGLELFAEYHDIGKVALPKKILEKQGINVEEYAAIKRHCEIGQRIALDTPNLQFAADWILKHHEWWNGSGYPLGLKGDEIPLECRMLSIVDAYENMVGGHYVSKAKSTEEALAEIRYCSGTQFDPGLVETFCRLW
jgi:HD-GYP domain-containing protein (c-di-GMP phosphodiesterase class II)